MYLQKYMHAPWTILTWIIIYNHDSAILKQLVSALSRIWTIDLPSIHSELLSSRRVIVEYRVGIKLFAHFCFADVSLISALDSAGRQESFNHELDAEELDAEVDGEKLDAEVDGEEDLRDINVINIFIGPQNASRNNFLF